MKRTLLSLYGKAIQSVLAFIGIIVTSCVEYGSPYAEFIIKGKVTDKTSHQPIRDINIVYKLPGSKRGIDTVKTDANGEYTLKTDWIVKEAWLYAEDTDGEQNGGQYAPDSLRMSDFYLKQTRKGDGRWFEGTFEKNDADFSLRISTIIGPKPMYGVISTEFKEK